MSLHSAAEIGTTASSSFGRSPFCAKAGAPPRRRASTQSNGRWRGRKSAGLAGRALIAPERLVSPDQLALGDAHFLLGIGNGASDGLRLPAVLLQDRQRKVGGGRVDHIA